MVDYLENNEYEVSNEERWKYNGRDCYYTLEIVNKLLPMLETRSPALQDFYNFQIAEIAPAMVAVMQKGVRIDVQQKSEQYKLFAELLIKIETMFNEILGQDINLKSSQQVKSLFKDLLEVEPELNKKTKTESFGAAAMLVYAEKYPLYNPLFKLLLEYKSIGVFVRNFLSMPLDVDQRMRCSYNVAGTDTYRFASRKNAFGTGGNLQNLPSKGKIDIRYALQELSSEEENLDIDSSIASVEGIMKLPNVKKIFLPDVGYVFFDMDYSSADAQFVAWDSDCEFLKKIFKAKEDLYSIVASHYYQREIVKKDKERQIFKQVCHACVTGDHEVLTENGWINIEDLQEFHRIAVWDKDTQDIWFETPKAINRDFVESSEDLYHIEGAAFSFLGTQDHKFPATTDIRKNIKKYEAIKLPKSAKIPYNGYYVGGENSLKPDLVRLIAALQADGHIEFVSKEGIGSFSFRFTKQRKITRLKAILTSLGIDFTETVSEADKSSKGNLVTRIRFKGTLDPKYKTLSWDILQLPKEELCIFLEELQYWDGHNRTSNGVRTSITTTIKQSAEIIQTIAHLCGKASKIVSKPIRGNRQPLYEVSINNREFHSMTTNYSRGLVKHEGTKVYCPQTSTGYFVYRYRGNIAISSNTHYKGKAGMIASLTGLSVGLVMQVQDWYLRQCPEVREWHNNVESLVRSGHPVSNIWGAEGWFTDFNDHNLINKAVAWIPQSSVGILVNKGIVRMLKGEYQRLDSTLDTKDIRSLLTEACNKKIECPTSVLGQTHDSAWGQYDEKDLDAPIRLVGYMELEIPYQDKLIIPAGIKTSNVSYGDC